MTKDITHLKDLTPDPRNARKHNPRNVGMIETSLQTVGAARSIVIDEAGVVLAGNATIEAAAAAGIERVQVVDADGETIIAVRRTGLTPEQKTKLALFDNRTAELAEWDVSEVLATLEAGVNLDALWRPDELEALVKAAGQDVAAGEDKGPQVDRAEELGRAWGVQAGQLWEIPSKTVKGKSHRLLCGDSTKAEDVARLMGGQRADLCMTSPPYWVGKEYEQEKTWADVLTFIDAVSDQLAAHVSKRIVINTGAPPAAHLTGKRAHVRLLLDDWQRSLERHGWLLRYARIWAKRGGLAHTAPQSDCIDQHWEFIGVFYHPDRYEGQRRCGEKWATDGIWDDVQGAMSSHDHIAAYPIEIPSRNIVLYTDAGALVYEPFTGSGTTLVACEQLGRVGYGMELQIKYAGVILQRLADMGLEPRLMT